MKFISRIGGIRMKTSFVPQLPSQSRTVILLGLAAAMLGTRLGHFRGLPDASWAVFFLGGLYLRSAQGFLLLMTEAVAIDYLTTQYLGVCAYCISPAYGFLLPAYGSLWLGGRLCSEPRQTARAGDFAWTALMLALSATACFAVTNASFYWLSGRIPHPTVAGWWTNSITWYPAFVSSTVAYVGIVLALHRFAIAGRRVLAPAS
jgi:hypothetical protein